MDTKKHFEVVDGEMNRGWFKVVDKAMGRRFFARVDGVRMRSDDGYSRWEEPVSYRVVSADQKGYVEEPRQGVVGAPYRADEFWQTYERADS